MCKLDGGMSMLKQVQLDDSAFEYLQSSCRESSSIGQKLCQLPLENGEIITFVPPNTPDERIKQYSWGIVEISRGSIYPLEDMWENMISIILDFLAQNNDHCVIIEDIVDTPHNLQIFGNQTFPILVYGEEVYYPIGQKEQDREKIKNILYYASSSYVFNGIMTHYKWSQKFYETLTNQDIDQIVEDVEMVFTSAYDNEGFIIWRRKNI